MQIEFCFIFGFAFIFCTFTKVIYFPSEHNCTRLSKFVIFYPPYSVAAVVCSLFMVIF